MISSKDRFHRYDTFWRRQCFEYHPVFGWWHIPNLSARLMLGRTYHRFVTNSAGMREERDFPHEKPAGRIRIVALGDSYTAGDGVSNDRRATSLLAQRFASLDVLNFGLNGSGTDQQLLIFEHLAKQYEADAYIWFFCVENIARNKYTCFPSYNWHEHREIFRPKPYFERKGDELVLKNVPVPREERPADALGDWQYEFPYLPDEYPSDPYGIYNKEQGEHWLLMKAIIRRFLNQVAPAPVFLVPLPMYQHYFEQCPPSYMPRFMELSAPQHNVHVLNILPAFTIPHKISPHLLRFPDDPHYTAVAHSQLADALEYQIKRLLPELSLRAGLEKAAA